MRGIQSILVSLMEEIRAREIRSAAFPSLDSGLGGLPWQDVRERMEAV